MYHNTKCIIPRDCFNGKWKKQIFRDLFSPRATWDSANFPFCQIDSYSRKIYQISWHLLLCKVILIFSQTAIQIALIVGFLWQACLSHCYFVGTNREKVTLSSGGHRKTILNLKCKIHIGNVLATLLESFWVF